MDKQSQFPKEISDVLPKTLKRLSSGLPKHEIDIIVTEARACESAL